MNERNGDLQSLFDRNQSFRFDVCVCVCVCSVCNDIKCQELESLCQLQHWNEPSNIGS